MKYISKTKVKQNQQCPKLLYLENNSPKLKEISAETQKTFDKGRVVESLAKSEYRGGKEVKGFRHEEKLSQTNYFLTKEKVIFEASFTGDGIFIQVDILVKNDDGTYDAIEVKSGTKINDEYFKDVLIQYFTILRSGKIKLKNYYVWYINKNATSSKDIFVKENIINQLPPLENQFDELIKSAKETTALTKEPDVKIGPHCSAPYECPFKKYCWKDHLTNPKSVVNLPNYKDKWKVFSQGIEYISDEKFPLEEYKEKNPFVLKALLNHSLEKNEDLIKEMLSKYQYPLYFFDVETFMTPIPVLKDQRPYQQVVVQYSIHSLDKDKTIKRKDFLHDSKENPESSFIESLIQDVGDKGDIVVYNKTFEATRLKEIANNSKYSHLKEKIESLIDRLQDLLDVVKKAVYHPDFMGSFSLKSIVPVLVKDYEAYTNSKIKNGSEVSDIYIQFLEEKDPIKKEELREILLTYNRLDTINVLLVYLLLKDPNEDIKKILSSID